MPKRLLPECIRTRCFITTTGEARNPLFLSPEMFREFFVPAYKKIYGFWKENGVELIVHHSDSYGGESGASHD